MTDDTDIITELNARKVDIDTAHEMITKKQKTLIGRLPFMRSKLASMLIHNDYQRMRVDAAIDYMNATRKK